MTDTSAGIALAASAPQELRERLRPLGEVREVSLGASEPDETRAALAAADVLVVSAAAGTALPAIRQLHGIDPSLQVILLAPPERRREVERALLFAPGLGEVWLVAPEDLGRDDVERAAQVTRQRRRYRTTRARIEADLSAAEPQRHHRALISDAYLAALLQVLPDPVLSVDEGDRVLSWNPAAEQVFGFPAPEAVGRSMLDVVSPADRPGLELTLAEAASSVQRTEVEFRTRSGDRGIAEVIVVPVEAAGHRVRSVVVHDLTEQRRIQAALEEQASELEAQAVQLQDQATELEMLNEVLQKRTEALEEAMAARSRFYAAMSHELRTPMNAIIGYNSLLLDEIFGPLPPRQAEALSRSQRAANHLLELVNDVLDLAKIEAGRIDLEAEPTGFPALLDELVDTVRPMAEERGVQLLLEPHAEEHTVLTDPRRVRQILLNLLSNALKFGEGRPVRLAWRPLPDGGVRIEVADQGRGIAPEHLSRIFDEFVQIDTQDQGGTGLGLPISKRLSEALAGRLEVASTPGEGSVFSLVLPASLAGAPPEQPH